MADGNATNQVDLFDDEAQATPQSAPEPPVAPAPPPKPAPGSDLFDDPTDQNDNSLTSKAKSYWDWANKSLLAPEGGYVSQQLAHENEIGQRIIDHEIAAAHPWRAGLAQMYYGSLKDAGQVAQQLTTPTQVGIMLASAKFKLFKGLANLFFAGQGAKAMYDEHLAAKDFAENLMHGQIQGDPDAVQRFLYGAAGLASGAEGTAKGLSEFDTKFKSRVQEKLGISGDLADEVASKVRDAHEIRQKGAQRGANVMLTAAQKASDVLDASSIEQADAASTKAAAEMRIPVAISQIMKDAIPVVLEEESRVGAPFEQMKEMAEDPVTDAGSLRASIIDTIKSHGIQDHEIPSKIFDALARPSAKGSAIGIEGVGAPPAGTPAAESFRALLESQGVIGEDAGVNFSTLQRVRNDLYNAAQKAPDARISAALKDALHTVTKMQEDYAVTQNFGNSNKTVTIDGQPRVINEMLRAANLDYMKFKRELGGGEMSDFLNAETLRKQMTTDALAKFMSPKVGGVLRALFAKAGIDVKPLDDLINEKAEATATLKEGGKAATKQAGTLVSQAQKQAGRIESKTTKAVNDLGKESPLIAGQSDYKLLGKTTEEIRRDKLNALAEDASQKGMTNPYAIALTLLGLARMVTGGFVSGGFLIVRGRAMAGAKNMAEAVLKNKSFQDWAIRDAGVHPTNTTMIGKLRAAFDSIATSGAFARAADKLASKPEQETQEESPY